MQYLKPYTYFLSKPNGSTNWMWGSLMLASTLIVPFLGQLVVIGYQAETADDLKRDPEIAEYPDFDINRFVTYLTRGIWPFLMNIVVGVFIGFLAMIATVIGFAIVYLTQVPWVGIVAGLLLLIPLTLIGTMLTWPLTLHAQLTREFQLGNAIRFARGFISRVGGQLFISLLIHFLISFPLSLLGLLLCIVGLYPAMMIQFMAQEHYMIQLYRLYLDEGGEPIPDPQSEEVLELEDQDEEDLISD